MTHFYSLEAEGMEKSLLPRYPAIFLSSCFDWSDENTNLTFAMRIYFETTAEC